MAKKRPASCSTKECWIDEKRRRVQYQGRKILNLFRFLYFFSADYCCSENPKYSKYVELTLPQKPNFGRDETIALYEPNAWKVLVRVLDALRV